MARRPAGSDARHPDAGPFGFDPSSWSGLPGLGAQPGAVSRVRRAVVVLVAGLAVFAVCAVLAADGQVGPTERAAFHAVNRLPEGCTDPWLGSSTWACWPSAGRAAGALALQR